MMKQNAKESAQRESSPVENVSVKSRRIIKDAAEPAATMEPSVSAYLTTDLQNMLPPWMRPEGIDLDAVGILENTMIYIRHLEILCGENPKCASYGEGDMQNLVSSAV